MFSGQSTLLRRLHDLIKRDDGQDMAEYALLIALIATGATASLHSLATLISSIFTNIEAVITSNIT